MDDRGERRRWENDADSSGHGTMVTAGRENSIALSASAIFWKQHPNASSTCGDLKVVDSHSGNAFATHRLSIDPRKLERISLKRRTRNVRPLGDFGTYTNEGLAR